MQSADHHKVFLVKFLIRNNDFLYGLKGNLHVIIITIVKTPKKPPTSKWQQ